MALTVRHWAHRDQELFFIDNEAHNAALERFVLAYEDYENQYNRRYGSLGFDSQTCMIHGRLTKHRPSVWAGYRDGVDMQALRWVGLRTFVL